MHRKTIIPFVIAEYPDVTYEYKIIGTFDIQYTFDENWSKTEEDIMDAWLCHNCNSNFIFSKQTDQIIAGGCVNNATDWEDRHSKNGIANELFSNYFVRLHNADKMLFEMVWLSHFK